MPLVERTCSTKCKLAGGEGPIRGRLSPWDGVKSRDH